MKTLLLSLVMVLGTNAYAAVNLDAGKVELMPEIKSYLAEKLSQCSLPYTSEETFTIEKMDLKKVRVDQGIIDDYYTFEISYLAVRNDEVYNTIKVEVLDADFDNWREYSEKLSFEIKSDEAGFCRK